MDSVSSRIMTVCAVAGCLNVDEKIVYRILKRSGLPNFRVVGTWRFRRSGLENWIGRQKKAAQMAQKSGGNR